MAVLCLKQILSKSTSNVAFAKHITTFAGLMSEEPVATLRDDTARALRGSLEGL